MGVHGTTIGKAPLEPTNVFGLVRKSIRIGIWRGSWPMHDGRWNRTLDSTLRKLRQVLGAAPSGLCSRVLYRIGTSRAGTDVYLCLRDGLEDAEGSVVCGWPDGTQSQRHTQAEPANRRYLADDDCEDLLDALDKRDLLSYTYDEEATLLVEDPIKGKYFPASEGLEASLKTRLNQ